VIAAATADARGFARFRFEVGARSGKVAVTLAESDARAKVPRPVLKGALTQPTPAIRLNNVGGGVAYRSGQILVRDAAGTDLATVAMARKGRLHIPWSVVLKDTAVFAWREESPKGSYRDVWTAIAIPSGKILWRRGTVARDPAGAWRLGKKMVVVDLSDRVEVIDARSGKTRRTIKKSDSSFSVTSVGGFMLEAGDTFHLLDPKTGASTWSFAKKGRLISWISLPTPGEILLRTDSRSYRLDTATGKAVWSVPSASAHRSWLAGKRILEPSIERVGKGTVVRLRVRRLRDGTLSGNHRVQRYEQFYDIAHVEVIGVEGDRIALETGFVILD